MFDIADVIQFFSILPPTLPYLTSNTKDTKGPPNANNKKHKKSAPKHDRSKDIINRDLYKPTTKKEEQQIDISAIPVPQIEFTVNIKKWEENLRHLASMNRWAKTKSSQIHQAGEWLAAQLREIPNIEVETDSVTVNEHYDSFNIIGTLKGTSDPDSIYVIGAHYDSTSEDQKVAAPGALDNASGSAAVLEMARIFSEMTFPYTIVFILFTGEEQGYYGSKKYVRKLFIKDQTHQVKLMLNMDMISLDQDIILESRHKRLISIWEPLARVNLLVPKIAYSIWGSDHVTFDKAGIPSILTCSDHDKYPHYHKTTDLPDNLHIPAGLNTITMNVQAIYTCMQADVGSQ